MELDRRIGFKFSAWAPEFGTQDSNKTKPEGTETSILGIGSSELHNKSFSSVTKLYSKHKESSIMLQLLQQNYRSTELESKLEEPWSRDYKDNKLLIDGLHYYRQNNTSSVTVIDRDQISLIL
ncbi:hypothetical protein O181_072556 [Austropuccinia psidii MF-1]|uniref:Uncharacterized protein n=1 Tax=Austropuccinia psidii MF-1 TaxID=1389203 RepID=A0A9Q3I7I2_9BASI|nr:hypothetical protein [Austropuccinia psidii MF-1]